MNICLCGSIAFYEDMLEVKRGLEARGHVVTLPPSEVPDATGVMIPVAEYYRIRKLANDDDTWVWDLKNVAMKNHFNKVADADAVLLVNKEKNGVPGYVGANTFLEAGLALHLGKTLYFLHEIPQQSNREELFAMKPVILYGDLEKIGKEM